MSELAVGLELPPLTRDVDEAKSHLRDYGIARIADALSPDAVDALLTRAAGAGGRRARGRHRLLRRRRRQPARVWNLPSKGDVFCDLSAHADRAHVRPPHPRGRLLPVEPYRQHRRSWRRADGAPLGPGLRAAVHRHGTHDERDVDAGGLHRGERRHPSRSWVAPQDGRAAPWRVRRHRSRRGPRRHGARIRWPHLARHRRQHDGRCAALRRADVLLPAVATAPGELHALHPPGRRGRCRRRARQLLGLRVWRTLGGVQGPWGPGSPGQTGFHTDGFVDRSSPYIGELR